MTRAAELLKDYSIPIKAIASLCGYSVVNNFYRDFKVVHGTSPMQMRQMQMNILMHDDKDRALRAAMFTVPTNREMN